MEAYLRAFVNWEQNDWARLLPMAGFAYNNAKNARTGHSPFELNCGYHPRISFEEDIDPRSKSCSTDVLANELRELMTICPQNLLHAQDLQKRAHDKGASLEAKHGVKRFGSLVITSRPRGIENSKPN